MTDLQAQAREMLAEALDANDQHTSAAACRDGNNSDCFVVPRAVALRAIVAALQYRADDGLVAAMANALAECGVMLAVAELGDTAPCKKALKALERYSALNRTGGE